MKRVDRWELVAAVAMRVQTIAIQTGAATRRGVVGHTTPIGAYAIATRLSKLASLAKTLHRLAEQACNEDVVRTWGLCVACGGAVEGRPQHGHTARKCFYANVERLEKRAEAIGAELGCVVETQRDPRGASVKIWADKVEGRMLGCF